MSAPIILDDDFEHVFLRAESAGGSALWWAIGGCVALGFAALGLVIALVGGVNQFALHSMTTFPTIVGIGALGAAWTIARTPRQVSISEKGLCVEGRRGTQRYTWDQVGWATVGAGSLNHRRRLAIYDTRGKSIAALGEAFDNFDTMVDLVENHIEAKGDNTAERIQRGKSKRSAALTGGFGLVMAAISIGVGYNSYREQRAARLLDEAAMEEEGQIVRRFLAPNGVTPRLEYRAEGSDGRSATHNVEVERDYWDSLQSATSVPIEFAPDEPSISRLAEGEVEEDDFTKTPLGGYVIASLGSALSLFMLAAGMLQLSGWDIDLDSKTGKISIKRFGTGR